MAVSKNRRKNKKKTNKSRGITQMRRLLQEGIDNFTEVHNTLTSHHQDIAKLINTYHHGYVWADDTPIETIRIANEAINNIENGLQQNQVILNNCFNTHSVLQAKMSAKDIDDADVNWQYIELIQTLLNDLTPFIGHAMAALENVLRIRIEHRKQ